MTSVDIIVLLMMGGAAIFGFMRGFVTEALSLVAWVFAIAVVKTFHAPVASALEKSIGTASGASTLAAAVLFGFAMFGGRMIARKIGGETKKSFIGPFDRVLGFGFGAVKGLLLATIVFLFFKLIFDTIYGAQAERPAWLADSRTYPLLSASARAVVGFVDERRGERPNAASQATDR